MAEQAATLVEDPDERPVEEVRCVYTGVPLPSIPSWYAGVKVKFFSEASKKSTAAPINLADLENARLRSVSADGDEDGDDLDADLDLEDVDLDLDDDTEDSESEVE